MMRGKQWLEPCMPHEGKESAAMLDGAYQMVRQAARLEALLSPITRERIGDLLRITNSYYTNLIEGQHTEPALLAAQTTRRDAQELLSLAYQHMAVQARFEAQATAGATPQLPWPTMFDAQLVSNIHLALFNTASQAELTLADGVVMVPGELRSVRGLEVTVGSHMAPAADSLETMLSRLQEAYGRYSDPAKRIISAMACHHRMAFVHPFPDGNGRVVRLLTHLQLHYLGLASPLWSMSRGLAKRQQDYYRLLAAADQPRRGDLDGRGQLTHSGLCNFIEFMLDVCLDQMHYIEQALNLDKLEEAINHAIVLAPELKASGIKPAYAPALKALFMNGKLERAVFKRFLGTSDRLATEVLSKLIKCGVVHAESAKSRVIEVGLPLWYAEYIFPDLHRRFAILS
ncbi:MAG: Fic family protein [Pseudomonadaceae bacterium]|nr:MAG: Fic family protein [Pseudomonadaceae bacterium]